ncbi:DUF4188 domain-containing protein [Phenylobacterium montanum]|uniref:DUF4188 domain-containing protein n=1 Tax=Phenylobacterium montanum TaxID=2823693 RepID=A0A975G0M9_9CAUL|nr:DUF4188 domain-containing protein [Caulobacter sp. S6]QUD88372.1 DUF4188 domain-containing protein [Caulobacter sp. S6]
MVQIIDRRVGAEIEGDFVLFLIGMRINKPWKIGSWLPVAQAMPKMLAELARQPDLGLLHVRSHFGFPNVMAIQYWRSFDHLEAYARARDKVHLPAWQAFNKAVGSNGDVGIWHETYLVSPGRYEAIYNNMPRYGLGAAGDIVDAVGFRQEARQRVKAAIKASAEV